MAKLTKAQLKLLSIHNPHNIMTKLGNKLYISYTEVDNGRAGHGAHWQVIGNNFVTDEKAHWSDYGRKTFLIWNRTQKEAKLQEALAWVKETYGLSEFERDPFGCYQIKGTMAKLVELYKQANNKG